MGITEVTALAASAAGVLVAAITVTWRWIRSAAIIGSQSYCPSAQRYSITTFWPPLRVTVSRDGVTAGSDGKTALAAAGPCAPVAAAQGGIVTRGASDQTAVKDPPKKRWFPSWSQVHARKRKRRALASWHPWARFAPRGLTRVLGQFFAKTFGAGWRLYRHRQLNFGGWGSSATWRIAPPAAATYFARAVRRGRAATGPARPAPAAISSA